jgi:AcrR family transcriptional regulator
MSAPQQARSHRPGGRPREGRVDEAIATAVRELLTEVGYARLTTAEVAARAGVGKAAIYRRHATKQEMIFDVLLPDRFLAVAPDRGSLRADLAAVLAEVAQSMTLPPPGTVPGLLADIHADPALRERFDEKYLGAQRAKHADPLGCGAVGQRDHAAVAASGGERGQRDSGVSRGGLQHRPGTG